MSVKKDYFSSVLLPLVIIPIGGLFALGICYLFYLFIYNFVEFYFFSTDPTSVPADALRRTYALALLILYLALLRTQVSDLLKVTSLVGPMGIFVTTVILAFYQQPALAVTAIVVIVAVCIFLLYRYKKPWIYYYAVVTTVLTAIALAWPKA